MIILPKQPKIIGEKDNWARFEIEGLYPGYGVTVGNSLRRVLLSSLEGAAVTQVKIKGVSHEFSTMEGVMEDVITIIMNLKQMRFKLYGDEPQKAALKVKGEKEVKGSDFEFPSQVELINKNCHIATLTGKKTEFEMEIQIEKGIGYEPVEMRKEREKLEIGVLPVDAIYTPIKRVSFKVENMRVGERTDFDRLILDIETDGTVDAKKAFVDAVDLILNHFNLIGETFKEQVQAEMPKEKKIEAKEEKADATKVKVEEMKLSQRTINALTGNGVKTAAGVAKKTEKSLLELEGMGEAGLKEIKKALKKLGLELKE
ncbi:MAG: DNA-directed RNA polymerase subunit alpha [Candidatus Nealsonbacteria bacterium]|nr:DNA-directed RNA polymerase subunit alpha [Candidatus Nealsonbacteria bacterium]